MSVAVWASIAVLAGLAGTCTFVAGCYVLWGSGWALLAAAPPLIGLSVVLLRGTVRGVE